MSMDADWLNRLQAAADAVKHSSGTPDWLKTLLLNAIDAADDLAPIAGAEPVPPTFFYPH